jgi:protein-disulfide isomerase
MKKMTGASLIAVALMLTSCGGGDGNNAATANLNSALPQIPAPNNGDWSQVVTQTAEGGFRMGNPDAPVKLVEYASATCPHCRAFSEEATERLRDTYVKSGQVSFEYRNFVLNALDAAASLVARCQGPQAFFRINEQLFANQEQWTGALSEEEQTRITQLPEGQQVPALFRAADLDQFFRQRGVPEARINQCLANQQELQRLADMRQTASDRYQIPGTPGFLINDELVRDVTTWGQLEPVLRERIGG